MAKPGLEDRDQQAVRRLPLQGEVEPDIRGNYHEVYPREKYKLRIIHCLERYFKRL